MIDSPMSAPPQPSALLQEVPSSEEGLPANLGRLGMRNGRDDDAGSMRAAATATPPPSKYTWFSLYDEQGVGGRRNTSFRVASSNSNSGSAGSGNAGGFGSVGNGNSNDDKKIDTPKESSSGKAEGSWRWGWGRKGSDTSLTPKAAAGAEMATLGSGAVAAVETATDTSAETAVAEAAPANPSGGKAKQAGFSEVLVDDTAGEEETPQALEVLSTFRSVSAGGCVEEGAATAAAAAAAAGKRLAESVGRERERLRRKDIYSYFMMPLVRALEAQMGTAAWLRKVGFLLIRCSCFVLHAEVFWWLERSDQGGHQVLGSLRSLALWPRKMSS